MMSKIRNWAFAVLVSVAPLALFNSCDEEILSSLSSSETVAALKEALTVGSQVAASQLGEEGGYFNDLSVKIGLPEEVQVVQELLSTDQGKALLSSAGASDMQPDNLILLMNRAAEKAAPQSAEIFANAITGMTIADGENILFGADNAATEYLHEKTYSGLQSTFGEVVTSTFDEVSVADVTLNDAWDGFSKNYNKIVSYKNTTAGKVAMVALKVAMNKAGKSEIYDRVNSMQSVNTNLGEYVTGKALDGLFLKVANKEADIRQNASSRTSDLLKRVFGRLDK